MAEFRVIIKGGALKFMTPAGRYIPMLRFTSIGQWMLEPGYCEFEVYVNDDERKLLRYNPKTRHLETHDGEVLEAEVLWFSRKTDPGYFDIIRVRCKAGFPYDTKHD